MPELPEVETIRRGLRRLVRGRRVTRVEVRDRRLRIPVRTDFAADLAGRVIVDVDRRAKYLLLRLDADRVWIVHLGMSGKLIRVADGRPLARHDHIVAHLDDGAELRLHDPRRFGLSVILPATELAAWPPLRRLAPDPFDPRFDGPWLYARARASRRTIKDLLMDQTEVAGLGNIYVNEVLYRAGVRPGRRACRLGAAAAERIARACPALLEEAIRWCGTSLSDYRDGEDREGGFQAHLCVYGRTGEACRACGGQIRRTRAGNRSSFYCPRCQK